MILWLYYKFTAKTDSERFHSLLSSWWTGNNVVAPCWTHSSELNMSSSIRTCLHEVSRHQCFADVDVVISAGEVRAWSSEVEPIHDTWQLLADVVGALQWPEVDEVVIAPLRIIMVYHYQQQFTVVTIRRSHLPSYHMLDGNLVACITLAG